MSTGEPIAWNSLPHCVGAGGLTSLMPLLARRLLCSASGSAQLIIVASTLIIVVTIVQLLTS